MDRDRDARHAVLAFLPIHGITVQSCPNQFGDEFVSGTYGVRCDDLELLVRVQPEELLVAQLGKQRLAGRGAMRRQGLAQSRNHAHGHIGLGNGEESDMVALERAQVAGLTEGGAEVLEEELADDLSLILG